MMNSFPLRSSIVLLPIYCYPLVHDCCKKRGLIQKWTLRPCEIKIVLEKKSSFTSKFDHKFINAARVWGYKRRVASYCSWIFLGCTFFAPSWCERRIRRVALQSVKCETDPYWARAESSSSKRPTTLHLHFHQLCTKSFWTSTKYTVNRFTYKTRLIAIGALFEDDFCVLQANTSYFLLYTVFCFNSPQMRTCVLCANKSCWWIFTVFKNCNRAAIFNVVAVATAGTLYALNFQRRDVSLSKFWLISQNQQSLTVLSTMGIGDPFFC